jgi:hypothetical protein
MAAYNGVTLKQEPTEADGDGDGYGMFRESKCDLVAREAFETVYKENQKLRREKNFLQNRLNKLEGNSPRSHDPEDDSSANKTSAERKTCDEHHQEVPHFLNTINM